MPALSNNVFDNGLNYIVNNTEKLYILSADPGLTWANIATYGLGSKSAPLIAAPADLSGGGRQVTVYAITDGLVNRFGIASHFALTDDSESEILVSGPLNESQDVFGIQRFTLTEFKVGIPDPAS